MTPLISIVVPLYNEEKVFGKLIGRLKELMDSVAPSIEVVLVDDGSVDGKIGRASWRERV